jgi:uncharacterized protein YcnI/copper(I)-binding protein
MRRLVLQFAAAVVLTAVSIVTAYAHASLQKGEAAPGSYTAVLKIPHGCDGKATNRVQIDVPEGYVGVKPMPKAGWTLETRKGDYAKRYDLHGEEVTSGVTSVTWSDGSLPDEFFDEFVLSGTLAGVEEGQKLFFKVLQQCDGGEVAWNQEPAEGQDPHSLEHPAPSLTILAETSGHGHGAHGAAEAVTAGDLTITGAWARAMLPGQPAGGGYMTITNKGQTADRLVSASSPSAGKVEIHNMEVVDNVMVMRPVQGLEIPAGGTVELKSGGLHMMFTAVKELFKEGGSVPITLEFEKAGKVEVTLPIQAKQGADEHTGHTTGN